MNDTRTIEDRSRGGRLRSLFESLRHFVVVHNGQPPSVRTGSRTRRSPSWSPRHSHRSHVPSDDVGPRPARALTGLAFSDRRLTVYFTRDSQLLVLGVTYTEGGNPPPSEGVCDCTSTQCTE